MGIANVDISSIRHSAETAASAQWRQLETLRFDVSEFQVRPLPADSPEIDTCGVVAADAGMVSVALEPFHLELLHVTDNRGKPYLTEFFPLTTLAEDLRLIFENNAVLQRFCTRLGVDWLELTDMWERADTHQPPMPRDVRLIADSLREIAEWAVAMELASEPDPAESGQPVRRLVLHDGTLASILLRPDITGNRMPQWWRRQAWEQSRVVVAGVAKGSMIWQRLALALSLDPRVKGNRYCYVIIPPRLEAVLTRRKPQERLGFGTLVLVKTRLGSDGQFLPVDLPDWIAAQQDLADLVIAQILRVSQTSFPQPGYPAPLEQAHDAAHLTEFDGKIVRDILVGALSNLVPADQLEPMLRYWSFQSSKWKKGGRIGRD